jgi:16S rRNA G966 N2-methylase RsmD
MPNDTDLFHENDNATASAPVECLGETFESDAARREHFLGELRAALDELNDELGDVVFTSAEDAAEKLAALAHWPLPEDEPLDALAQRMAELDDGDLLRRFKNATGFPDGPDAAILRLSDPPYYTACPNPFARRFTEHFGTPHDEGDDDYHREPFASDVSEGKYDRLYQAHSYHTKVPHKAIMRYLAHYTDPGDVVLDGFAGSGMTAVAAALMDDPDDELKATITEERENAGLDAPRWGLRRALVQDLGPAATFIAAGFARPLDVAGFKDAAQDVLDELCEEIGWMYETNHPHGPEVKGFINFTVWSQVLGCPQCGAEVVFHEVAMKDDGRVRKEFTCPQCDAQLKKGDMDRLFETTTDLATGEPTERLKRKAVLINYDVGEDTFEKEPDADDHETLRKIETLPLSETVPTNAFPIEAMNHGSRIAPKGVDHVHQMYLPRAAQVAGRLWEKVGETEDRRLRHMLRFWGEQALWGMSAMNRYVPTHYSHTNQYLSGVYYLGSQHAEVTPWYNLQNKLKRMASAFTGYAAIEQESLVSTGSTETLFAPSGSVDFIFTDPPFGENIHYADLNYLVESWHGLHTNAGPEAIVDSAKEKDLGDYRRLMARCFAEYHRVLKPGRWMTVVFHNSHNRVWHALQEALQRAGFVVADVRTLSKEQGSYRQVTSDAAKQDLVISTYKPSEAAEEQFALDAGTEEGAWDFVKEHLDRVPVFVAPGGRVEQIAERQPYLLYDRMVAFHVQRGEAVPLSQAEFYEGLKERFPERDGMYFLPQQTAEYDRGRLRAESAPEQLSLAVTDEATAIQWLRRELKEKPQTFQDLHPQFTQEIAGWDRYERQLELKTLLRQNFLKYEADENGQSNEVPGQIHGYLSSNYKNLRNLDKTSALLQAEADGRWYVPNPNTEKDLEKLREKDLLKAFAQYRQSEKKKLKTFRLEAVRAGFQRAWQEDDYHTILDVARKLPPRVIEEDPKLLMWRDHAEMRAGERPEESPTPFQ